MNNHSNWTGRMARSSREAFGHEADFGNTYCLGDKLVGWVTIFAAGFITGMLVAGGFQ